MAENNKTSALTVFVHVPKTAGSTVNAYLKRSGTLGATHIEAWVDDDVIAVEKLKSFDWVSGHVPFPHMRARLSANTSRPLRFFTLVRDPIKQLMSHYNWLIEIYHRGAAFYDGHPPRIKEISEAIRSANNDDPLDIIRQITAAPGLFLNQQSRLVFGEIPRNFGDQEFRESREIYNMIATEKMLPDFIEKISGVPYEDKRRENVSPYHFDKTIFESSVMKEFVKKHHAADLALYRYLSNS
jgi:hypothetical protein